MLNIYHLNTFLMKYYLSLIFWLLFSLSSFSQVKILSSKVLKTKTTLNCQFVIELSPTQNRNENYKVTTNLLDASNEPVYRGKEKTIYFSRRHSIVSGKLDIKIPYNQINLPLGQNTVKLELIVSKQDGEYPPLLSKKEVITMPKIFPYQDQKITITNLKLTDNAKQKQVVGTSGECYVSFKYPPEKIWNLGGEEHTQKYLLHIDIYKTKSKKPVTFYEKGHNSILVYGKKNRQKVNFFIPAHAVALPYGKYNLKFKLSFYSEDNSFAFGQNTEKNLTLRQPQIYFAKFEADKIWVVEKKYDASSALGRLFSRKSSNVGKGYPDVFWTLAVGNFQKYRSPTNKNAFSGFSATVNFTIADTDPIFFEIYDFDMLNRNDFIGRKKIEHQKGNDTQEHTGISFNNVESMYFTFHKMKVPHFKTLSFTHQPEKHNGTSGEMLTFKYHFSEIPQERRINFEPILMYKDKHLENFNFINIENKPLYAESNSRSGDLKLFVPYFNFPPKGTPGISVKLDNNFYLGEAFMDEKIKIPTITDIRLNLSTKEGEQAGIKGLFLTFTPEIPHLYIKELGQSGFRYSVLFTGNNFNDKLKNSLQNKLIAFQIENKYKKVFIPYYKVGIKAKKLKISINAKTIAVINDMQVGDNNSSVIHSYPELIEVKIEEIKAKLKFKYRRAGNYYKIRIYRGEDLIFQSAKLKASKYITADTKNTAFISHPEDLVKIIFSDPDNPDEGAIQLLEIKAKELNSKATIKKRLNRPFAKLTIK